MWQNKKLNFVALILNFSSNLFLVQIFSSTTQLIIVVLIQLHLVLFIFFLISWSRSQHTRTLAVHLAGKLQGHYFAVSCKASSAEPSHTLRINRIQSKPAKHAARSLLVTACSCTSSMAHGHVHDEKSNQHHLHVKLKVAQPITWMPVQMLPNSNTFFFQKWISIQY
jgi:hypothetical protein